MIGQYNINFNYLQTQKNIFKASVVHHLKPFLNKAKADAYFNSNVVEIVNHSFEMGNTIMKKLS